MRSSLPIAVLLAALVIGCADAPPAGGKQRPAASYAPDGYTGPELTARFDGFELRVAVQVGTGGYSFDLQETRREPGHTVVLIKLTAPAGDEAVTQALETKIVRVPLKRESGPVRVFLWRARRDTPPEYELARIVPR